jgi:ABC-type phosphate transport system ATPase subunit/protein-tyrosine phosphatase
LTPPAALTLHGFGVAFGEQTVLADVTLDLPPRGLTTLVGPAGSGKSTLLRTLAGLNDGHPTMATWGTALLGPHPLPPTPREVAGELRAGFGMVMQHARFYLASIRENLVSALPNRGQLAPVVQTRLVSALLEVNGLGALVPRLDEDVASLPTSSQRRLAIVRAVVSDPPVLLADEPTAGLDEDAAFEVVALLRAQASQRAVLFVTHNQRLARAAGGITILLASGRVQERADAHAFFDRPRTTSGECFLRTGRCVEAPPPLASLAAWPAPTTVRSRHDGPRGFFWIWPGRLGGMPRPGIVESLEHDVEALARLGISALVSLEEEATVDGEVLAQHGIQSLHLPVPDMGAPGLEIAEELGRRVDALLRAGGTVAMHCRAGLGRTGALLAAQLIFDGECARAAIERVRGVNPRCIQSQAQVEFLSTFERHLLRTRAAAPADVVARQSSQPRGDERDVT